jgi:hypothetical protein
MVMNTWFGKRATVPPGAEATDPVEAYREGRRDERALPERDAPATVDRKDIKAAYERGRLEERLRHRGSPLLSLLVLIVVIIGAGLIYLAIRNGSFSNGGAVVDRSLTSVSQTAQAPIKGAADKAGSALENAGQTLKKAGTP